MYSARVPVSAHARDRLPAYDGTFVARREERAAIDAAFAGGARLVMLTGPAGIGKTRLAVEWARGRTAPPGPALFVDVAGVTTLAGLCREVGDVLDVPLFSGSTEEHVERLGRSLAARGRVLLIADDLEAMVAIARDTLGTWIASAPDLRVLATSRERLGVDGEHVIELRPLDAAGTASSAYALFVDRVRAQRKGYAPSGPEAEAIARIVHALDGVPLAIELASARVAVASPRQLEALLEHVLSLLADPSRAIERHRSLRAAIDGSWQRLDAGLRIALARASLFEGPFALEAADALAPDVPGQARRVAALDRLHALALQSLVQVREEPELGGERRFRLLSIVRAYARERLAEIDDPLGAERAHAEAELSFVEELAEASQSSSAALRALLHESRNASAILERALARASDRAQAELAARALVALGRVYTVRAASSTYLAWAERLEPWLDGLAPRLRGRAWSSRGYVAIRAGDYALARRCYERGAAILDAIDPSYAAQLRARIASLDSTSDTVADPAALRARIVPEGTPIADPDRAMIEIAFGLIALRAHDEARARPCFETALEAARRSGHRQREGMALGYLAWCDLHARRFPRARARFEEASVILRDMEEQRLSVAWAGDVATVLTEEGSLDAARERLVEAVEAHRRLGDRWYEAERLGELGMIELVSGRSEHAEPALRESARLLGAAGDRKQQAFFGAALALSVAERGQGDDAGALLAEASEACDASALQLFTRGVAIVRATPGNERDLRLDEARAAVLAALDANALAVRMAARALSSVVDRLAARADAPARITIARDGSWIEIAEHRSSVEGTAPRRLAVFLARSRFDHPGRPLSVDVLFDAGWPGDDAAEEKRANRVRVALTQLRKAGLRHALLSQPEGYLLDPTIPIELL